MAAAAASSSLALHRVVILHEEKALRTQHLKAWGICESETAVCRYFHAIRPSSVEHPPVSCSSACLGMLLVLSDDH